MGAGGPAAAWTSQLEHGRSAGRTCSKTIFNSAYNCHIRDWHTIQSVWLDRSVGIANANAICLGPAYFAIIGYAGQTSLRAACNQGKPAG